ncbi:30S ribosomal protein S4 [Patescibacteria group bacterium]|nr:30S ribosomal protein S4 [Patescibacteria group bacterium]MBU2632982.1 30S ribosomal protein S4 [Patescibacteria group bacterium]
MSNTKCKTCRRVGQKLFLKEEKCSSIKCPVSRKPYPPGRKAKKMRPLSEYGTQLKEKQKLKFLYGLRERPFANYINDAMKKGGSGIGSSLICLLEQRLDNVVFRLGLARSRSLSRQIVSHGHICVNGRKVTIPSFRVKKGDKISIRRGSENKSIFSDLDIWLKKYSPPSWLRLDKDKKIGEVVGKISPKDIDSSINLNLIIEFYSR